MTAVHTSARLYSHPSALCSPVVNPVRRGRFPDGITPIWRKQIEREKIGKEISRLERALADKEQALAHAEGYLDFKLHVLAEAKRELHDAKHRFKTREFSRV